MPTVRRNDGPPGAAIALLAVALRPPSGAASLSEPLRELLPLLDAQGRARAWVEEALSLADGLRADREYHRLFLGPGRPVAPPFESVYRDRTILGPSAQSFLRELREAGVEPPEDFRLPADHVALELEYLAHLALGAEEARGAGRWEEAGALSDRARRFVDDRLAGWLPAFLGRLETGAPRSPYTAVVRAAAEILGLRADAGPRASPATRG